MIFLPVRHHSPACARMVRDEIHRLKPSAVLIEGPCDFNERIGELSMAHLMPIAIYSYVAWEDGRRSGVYYPLCDYSPEWVGLNAACDVGAKVRFIDLPSALLGGENRTHRYADGRLRKSSYMKELCKILEVENFDDAWDVICEQDPDLSIAKIHERVDFYCRSLRELDADANSIDPSDEARERFMAGHIQAASAEFGADRLVIITGGYHTAGLEALLASGEKFSTTTTWPAELKDRGIALTPYSFERLDNLKGYDSGMPSPGFYQEAWRLQGKRQSVHPPIMKKVVAKLRELKQVASTADLIAVESCMQALASLRGHARVWRRDLIDAVKAALVKDEVVNSHPFLRTLQEVLRGNARGKLAAGSPKPPIVVDIETKLHEADLEPDTAGKEREFPLTQPEAMQKSRLLHQLRLLEIPGFVRTGGVDFSDRSDLTLLTETWRIIWMPEQDAAMIEASRYGAALDEGVVARLLERALSIQRSSAEAAALLLDSVLAGVTRLGDSLRARVAEIIHEDGDLGSVAVAMGHLLFLYSWDDTLGTRGSQETGQLLKEAFQRATWLLESGAPAQTSAEEINGVKLMRDAFEQAESLMKLSRTDFAGILSRVEADTTRSPAQRGACAGALWSLHCADPEHIQRDLRLFSAPDQMGDFLTGLFYLAREQAQRDKELLFAINSVVSGWPDVTFLEALPSLRLAFSYFAPREKVFMATSLFAPEAGGVKAEGKRELLVDLAVTSGQAMQAMAFELKLCQIAEEYGIVLDPTGTQQ